METLQKILPFKRLVSEPLPPVFFKILWGKDVRCFFRRRGQALMRICLAANDPVRITDRCFFWVVKMGATSENGGEIPNKPENGGFSY